MRRRRESIAELLLKLPWWVSVGLGILAFGIMRWGSPLWAGDDPGRQILTKGIIPLAPLVLLIFGIFGVGSFFFARKRHRLVDEQTSLDQLRQISWKDFEYLVAEAYRRQGYQVQYSLGRGADGGVDLTLHRNGQRWLVQCKQWKVFSVGAPVIREMFGLMIAEKADHAVIVTSGTFTREARSFAVGKPIHLIDGPDLLALVQSVQVNRIKPKSQTTPTPLETAAAETGPPACPQCGKPMIERIARRGSNAGNHFWGCSAYPACKGISIPTSLVPHNVTAPKTE